jgi:hypothetical protein
MRSLALLLTLLTTLALARPAHADCTEDGSGCPGLAAAFAGVVIGGITEGSIAVGGLVTMAVGAKDLSRGGHKRALRIANVVFGALNLAAGVIWGGFAAARISPSFTIPFAVPHLAVGAADIAVGALSWQRRDHGPAIALVPVVGGDAQHGTFAGVALTGRF